MTKRLKVLTYNIHKGFGPGKIRFMLPKMRDAIVALDPDVIFLQEVQGQHKRQEKRIEQWPCESQLEYLAKEIWPHGAYAKNAIYQAGHHGNAILSKYPVVDCENINLSKSQRASRSLLYGVIAIEGYSKLHVVCTHLGLFKQERSYQIDRLCKRIQETIPEHEPLIIAGDFNDWRKQAVLSLEGLLGLHEVFKQTTGDYAKTFPAIKPTLSTDRIYYRDLTLLNSLCLKHAPWRLLSDHIPLWAEFQVEKIK